jgi:hypothetical protein
MELVRADIKRIDEMLPYGELVLVRDAALSQVASSLERDEMPTRWRCPSDPCRRRNSIVQFIHREFGCAARLTSSCLCVVRARRVSPSVQRVSFVAQGVRSGETHRLPVDPSGATLRRADRPGQGRTSVNDVGQSRARLVLSPLVPHDVVARLGPMLRATGASERRVRRAPVHHRWTDARQRPSERSRTRRFDQVSSVCARPSTVVRRPSFSFQWSHRQLSVRRTVRQRVACRRSAVCGVREHSVASRPAALLVDRRTSRRSDHLRRV